MSGVGLILRSNRNGRQAGFLMPGLICGETTCDIAIPSIWDTVPTNEKIQHSKQETTGMACNTATPGCIGVILRAASSPLRENARVSGEGSSPVSLGVPPSCDLRACP